MIAYPFGVDGVRLRVLEAGEGPETIVFLHGLGARADRWHENLEVFAGEGYRAFALDFPGHGFSEKSAGREHSVPSYARLVAAFVRDVGAAGSTTLVGTSLGGHVAATAALADPEIYRGVVLVGPVGLRELGPEARAAIAASIVDTSVEGIRRKLVGVLYDEARITPEWVREEHMINTSPGAAEALAAIARYFAEDVDGDVLGESGLHTLTAVTPTLFVWGEADAIIPLGVAEEVERLLGVTAIRIPAAGHLPYLENPLEFNRAVLEFLRSHASAPREVERAPTRS
jgi:pimeloyl-ACP methyl ester carboxylesterase